MFDAIGLNLTLPLLQGELEQLLLSEDPGMAERQCHFQSGDHVSKYFVVVVSGGCSILDVISTLRCLEITRVIFYFYAFCCCCFFFWGGGEGGDGGGHAV